jgi:hypothetical protein
MSDQRNRVTAEQTGEQHHASRYDTPAQIAENFQKWWMAMEASHTMLMAGLRDRIGEDGDLKQAYREWNNQRRARKMQAYEQAAKRFRSRQAASGESSDAPDAT